MFSHSIDFGHMRYNFQNELFRTDERLSSTDTFYRLPNSFGRRYIRIQIKAADLGKKRLTASKMEVIGYRLSTARPSCPVLGMLSLDRIRPFKLNLPTVRT
jgi:hypothetical protein